MVDRVGQLPVGLDHQRHVRRLHRDLHVVEPNLVEVRQLPLGGLHQCFRCGSAVLLVQLGVEGPGVHADADRHAARLGLLGHELDVGGLADVAGVEAQALHARLEGGEGEFVLEMDVGDDRHRRARDDPSQALGGWFLVARAAHDVGARARQLVDLGERPLDVGGLGDRHRLHADRRAPADRHVTDVYLPRLAPGEAHTPRLGPVAI